MKTAHSWYRQWAMLTAGAMLLVLVLAGLVGCSSQNETIGSGAHELAFHNEGDVSIPMVVRWADQYGYLQTEYFTIYVDGTVTLKTEPRLDYDIEMSPECNSLASAGPGPARQNQVIDLRNRQGRQVVP